MQIIGCYGMLKWAATLLGLPGLVFWRVGPSAKAPLSVPLAPSTLLQIHGIPRRRGRASAVYTRVGRGETLAHGP